MLKFFGDLSTYVECSLHQELVAVVGGAAEGVPDLVRVHVDPEVGPDFLLERVHLVALGVPQQGARLLGARSAEAASVHVPKSVCNQVSSKVERVAYGERLQALALSHLSSARKFVTLTSST